jgi:hypothetical protein
MAKKKQTGVGGGRPGRFHISGAATTQNSAEL